MNLSMEEIAVRRQVGARIRELRLAAGMTTVALARRTGLSQGQLSKIETGKAALSIAALTELCRVLDRPLSYLFEKQAESRSPAVDRCQPKRLRGAHRQNTPAAPPVGGDGIFSLRGPMHTTERLAQAALALRAEDLAQTTREAIRRCILDLLGAARAGSRAASATALRHMALKTFAGGPADAWFTDARLPPAAAAMVNAGAASALDLDDGHRGAVGHPGAAIIPAVLAVAPSLESSSLEVLAAIAVGYEVGCRVAAARDIHRLATLSTGRWAPYGVAAAVGRLQGLSHPVLAQALAIAGAQAPDLAASGYSKVMGNHVKEGIPWAVLTGISAVALAREGFTGPLDILDHPDWFDARRIMAPNDFGRAVEDVYFKPYSSCRWSHAAVDALAGIVVEHQINPATIERITVETFARALRLTNEPDPDTLEGAQYSIPFCLAVAACQGADSLLPLAEASLHDPGTVALARRVELKVAPDLDRLFPAQTPARVIVHAPAERIEKTVLAPRGDPANPLSQNDLEGKFRRLCASRPADWTQTVIDAVAGFEGGGLAVLLKAFDTGQRVESGAGPMG